MELQHILVILAMFLGLLMTWGVGANDLANIMSTALGSHSITARQALIIAIVFEFAGALLGGGRVAETIGHGIINIHAPILLRDPHIFLYGMVAVLMAGTTWILTASFFGLPVSITNAVVGALVGFGILVLGPGSVHWKHIIYIALSWISAPLIAGLCGYAIFRSIQTLILTTPQPVRMLHRYVPFYLFSIGVILSFMTIIKGLHHFSIGVAVHMQLLIAVVSGVVIAAIGLWWMKLIRLSIHANRHAQFKYIERVFAILMAFTACAMVFAHGSNDVAIAVGPLVAIVNLTAAGKFIGIAPTMIIALGCFGVVAGLMMYGRKVIHTVGSGITELTPSRAFSATIAAATTVVVSTGTGIPVSATQTLVGAVFGVGFARGIGALNLVVIRNILLSWIITLPAASVLAVIYYEILISVVGG